MEQSSLSIETLREMLQQGGVIPACPLALTPERRLDERHQRALGRYYAAAGAAGLAVGVHTTQFAIHDPVVGLYRPVLELAAEALAGQAAAAAQAGYEPRTVARVAGLLGRTDQALAEASTALELGYHCGLLGLGAYRDAEEGEILVHCRRVGEAIPLFGFYLQPAVGGRVLSYRFWREFAEIPAVVGVKIAPFNRYYTLDVVRAVADSGRGGEVALYTGNDDSIVVDLLTSFRFRAQPSASTLRIVGGLLGHWSVWTRKAVEMVETCRAVQDEGSISGELLTLAMQVTDANAAFFDTANNFRGCIAGLHEVLRRQGLMAGRTCLDPDEDLSPGQMEEIDRVYAAYPHLNDDAFIAAHLDEWLS